MCSSDLLARRRAQAKLEFKLVDSEEKALTVVRQYPEPGDELPDPRVIKVEIATRPWINHLPGVYQDADEGNADFLQRFLLISAHLTSSVEENLEFVHELFDPRITHAKWLPWLASWLAMPLLEGWDEEKRREIVQRTPELYRKRGTAIWKSGRRVEKGHKWAAACHVAIGHQSDNLLATQRQQ